MTKIELMRALADLQAGDALDVTQEMIDIAAKEVEKDIERKAAAKAKRAAKAAENKPYIDKILELLDEDGMIMTAKELAETLDVTVGKVANGLMKGLREEGIVERVGIGNGKFGYQKVQ